MGAKRAPSRKEQCALAREQRRKRRGRQLTGSCLLDRPRKFLKWAADCYGYFLNLTNFAVEFGRKPANLGEFGENLRTVHSKSSANRRVRFTQAGNDRYRSRKATASRSRVESCGRFRIQNGPIIRFQDLARKCRSRRTKRTRLLLETCQC
jgi:hypothetical protein